MLFVSSFWGAFLSFSRLLKQTKKQQLSLLPGPTSDAPVSGQIGDQSPVRRATTVCAMRDVALLLNLILGFFTCFCIAINLASLTPSISNK